MKKIFLLLLMTLTAIFATQNTRDVMRATALKVNGQSIGKVEDFGKYYALLVGVENYDNLRNLDTPFEDIEDVAELLEKRFGFEKPVIIKDPNRVEFLDQLYEIKDKLTKKDNLLIYYAGHGSYEKKLGKGYWLLKDAKKRRISGWVSLNEAVRDTLKLMPAKHVLVVADSCYSGELTRDAEVSLKNIEKDKLKYYSKISTKKSRKVLTSGGMEPVMDGDGQAGGHSVFAKAFINALAYNEKEIFALEEMFPTIKKIVSNNAAQTPDYGSIKNTGVFELGGDFIFIDYDILKKQKEMQQEQTALQKVSQKQTIVDAKVPQASKELQICEWLSYQSKDPNGVIDQKALQACKMVHSDIGKGYVARALYRLNKKEEARLAFEKIKNSLEIECNKKNASACNVLSFYYYSIKEDFEKVVMLEQKSCEMSSNRGCTLLGSMYEKGQATVKNNSRAATLYEKACKLNDGLGCRYLGLMHEYGKGTPKDNSKAATFYQKACELNDNYGCSNLGLFYRDGKGVSTDETKALSLFEKSCELYNGTGCNNLGFMYGKGQGTAKDESKAVRFYQKACELDSKHACRNLALGYDHGYWGLEKDTAKAKKLYQKACKLGNAAACKKLKEPVVRNDETFALTINPAPQDSRVQIMNIKPKYKDGISLKKGDYKIRVFKKGYETQNFTLNLQKNTTQEVKLEKIKKSQISNSTQNWITPTQSICRTNGGKIDSEGFCKANWDNAKRICSAAGGRLPRIDELNAVVTDCGGVIDDWRNNLNNTSYQACYKQKGFASGYYWSSSPVVSDVSGVWYVGFKDSGGGWDGKFYTHLVRCVRDSQ